MFGVNQTFFSLSANKTLKFVLRWDFLVVAWQTEFERARELHLLLCGCQSLRALQKDNLSYSRAIDMKTWCKWNEQTLWQLPAWPGRAALMLLGAYRSELSDRGASNKKSWLDLIFRRVVQERRNEGKTEREMELRWTLYKQAFSFQYSPQKILKRNMENVGWNQKL